MNWYLRYKFSSNLSLYRCKKTIYDPNEHQNSKSYWTEIYVRTNSPEQAYQKVLHRKDNLTFNVKLLQECARNQNPHILFKFVEVFPKDAEYLEYLKSTREDVEKDVIEEKNDIIVNKQKPTQLELF